MITPVVRLLLHFGITYPVFAELLKRVYVQVADRELTLPDREQTASRLALLTGIHRQEIRRLREITSAGGEMPIEKASSAAALSPRLLMTWTQNPRFRDPAGAPRLLHRSASQGSPSFEELVEGLSKDIRPRAVLDEWLRLGLVEITGEGLLELKAREFVPKGSLPAKTELMANIISDHVSAAVHNVRGDSAPFFDRRVRVEGLTPEALLKLRALVEERGMAFLQELNAAAAKLTEGEAEGPTHRMSIGLFEYEEREKTNEAQSRNR